MLHQTHPGVTRPTLLVVVTDDILIVGVWVHCQVPLDEVSSLFCSEPDVDRKQGRFDLEQELLPRPLC